MRCNLSSYGVSETPWYMYIYIYKLNILKVINLVFFLNLVFYIRLCLVPIKYYENKKIMKKNDFLVFDCLIKILKKIKFN